MLGRLSGVTPPERSAFGGCSTPGWRLSGRRPEEPHCGGRYVKIAAGAGWLCNLMLEQNISVPQTQKTERHGASRLAPCRSGRKTKKEPAASALPLRAENKRGRGFRETPHRPLLQSQSAR